MRVFTNFPPKVLYNMFRFCIVGSLEQVLAYYLYSFVYILLLCKIVLISVKKRVSLRYQIYPLTYSSMKKYIRALQIYLLIFCVVSYLAHDVIIGGSIVA